MVRRPTTWILLVAICVLSETPPQASAFCCTRQRQLVGISVSTLHSPPLWDSRENAEPSSTVPVNAASQTKSKNDAPIDNDTPFVPSYSRLLTFCTSTVLIWLSEPILSLVDTTIVGLTQGATATVQLAALGPATTLIDSLFYMTYFLSIATTTKIAKERATCEYRTLQRTTSHVLSVALVLGTSVSVFCLTCGRATLRAMLAGASATNTELIRYACYYTWIRGSVGATAVANIVLQSHCLANLDTSTPFRAVVAASLVNIVGDLGLQRYGVVGAAVATALASLVSTAILFRAVRQQFQRWGELSRVNGSSDNDDNTPIPMFQWPDRAATLDLLQLSGPIFFVIVAKILCYGAMNIRSTAFGMTSIAAHSIMMRIFFFFGCFGDAVSQAAQSFLPATLYPRRNQTSFAKIIRRLTIVAGCGGLVNWQVSVQILKRCGRFLTRDAAIIGLMKNHTGFFGAAVVLHAFIMMLEGTVMASRDFSTLIFTYSVTLGLHFGILKFFSGSFPAIWRTFLLFQAIRLSMYSYRVWRQQSKRPTVVVAEATS